MNDKQILNFLQNLQFTCRNNNNNLQRLFFTKDSTKIQVSNVVTMTART